MTKKKAYDYRERQTRNDRSRSEAENFMEPWTVEEVETLEKEWDTDPVVLEALASLLGRTVEACRQKHYDLRKRPEAVVEEKLRKVDKWTKGFTSLEDMGY